MPDSRQLSLIVGAFFIASLAAIGVAVLSLSSESGLFASQYRLYSKFENVQGLLPGAPVWMAGKEVGRVEAVEFTEFGSNKPILVTMRINDAIRNRVRTDSVATIGTIGVLGDSYIEIRPGSLEGSVLIDGEIVPAESPTNLYAVLARGNDALSSVSKLARSLNAVVSDVREEGVIAKSAKAVSAMSNIILEIETGNGMLHSVIYDTASGGGVTSIETSLTSIENILAEVQTGNGILNSLIYGEGEDSLGEGIEDALASLANILEEIKTGEGLLHTLIYDRESGNMSRDAMAAIARLDSILEKVEDGDGTLGLLISDPSLYEDLTLLLGGAKRSALLRTLVRMATDP
jgi:phospholipid/cholesterol/gamma-HCH transport system substrate-binding protein